MIQGSKKSASFPLVTQPILTLGPKLFTSHRGPGLGCASASVRRGMSEVPQARAFPFRTCAREDLKPENAFLMRVACQLALSLFTLAARKLRANSDISLN